MVLSFLKLNKLANGEAFTLSCPVCCRCHSFEWHRFLCLDVFCHTEVVVNFHDEKELAAYEKSRLRVQGVWLRLELMTLVDLEGNNVSKMLPVAFMFRLQSNDSDRMPGACLAWSFGGYSLIFSTNNHPKLPGVSKNWTHATLWNRNKPSLNAEASHRRDPKKMRRISFLTGVAVMLFRAVFPPIMGKKLNRSWSFVGRKSMVFQVCEELKSQCRFGESKHQAKATGDTDGIFSCSTLKTYIEQGCRFANWAKSVHNCRDLSQARQFVDEYLQKDVDRGLSPWTVKLERAALSKLYRCSASEWNVDIPQRERSDITRSRHEVARDYGFSEEKNADLVAFLRGTGLRRHEAEAVRPCDIHCSGNRVTVDVINGKGGKRRSVTVLEAFSDSVVKYAGSSKKPLFGRIKSHCDVHGYRGEYAKALYEAHARAEIPPTDRYFCRGDKKGVVYDRQAMAVVSRNLGHERLSVVAVNYL